MSAINLSVWVVAHDERRKFDREDERIIKMLSQFASAGWQLWKSRANAEITAESEHERTTELATANQRLQLQVSQRERAEEQLQQFNKELERRVEKRTSDLVSANADLSRTLEVLVSTRLTLSDIEDLFFLPG